MAAPPGRYRYTIVGTISVEHLEDPVEAIEIDLSKSDLEYLEELYSPVEIDRHE